MAGLIKDELMVRFIITLVTHWKRKMSKLCHQFIEGNILEHCTMLDYIWNKFNSKPFKQVMC